MKTEDLIAQWKYESKAMYDQAAVLERDMKALRAKASEREDCALALQDNEKKEGR